jgi:PadR family transcriptional regulator PadR
MYQEYTIRVYLYTQKTWARIKIHPSGIPVCPENVGKNKDRSGNMVFNTGAALLDAIVLAIVSRDQEGTYGYKITQDVRNVIEISESTLYPVLRRLQKEECLEVYDLAFDGRNRRYYRITEKGRVQLNLYKGEWESYSQKISRIFEEAHI